MTAANNLRILIVAEHASLMFGGEAALPLHYFRVLRQRGIETWLIVHERTRQELQAIFPKDFDRIYFIPDTFWHRMLWQLGKPLPERLANFTSGFVMRLLTQIIQRRLAKKIVQMHHIEIVHQPIPVTPKEPSMIFGLGVPVVIGPMNGGMNYPPAFQYLESRWSVLAIKIGRFFSSLMNVLIPGKRQATTLLVANSRTRDALPKSVSNNTIVELVENGVDLSIWRHKSKILCSENEIKIKELEQDFPRCTRLVYVGRLVDWKGVDLLLMAIKQIDKQLPLELEIIGDGIKRDALEKQARELKLTAAEDEKLTETKMTTVRFLGWLSQVDCAQQIQQSDILILPSLHECGGVVVLEAMAMGIPVIATKWGGPTDYLDESCGILVEPSSRKVFIDGLAAAILKLAQNPELCQQMGRAGYQRILDCFDWERKVDVILEIYRSSIERYAQKSNKSNY